MSKNNSSKDKTNLPVKYLTGLRMQYESEIIKLEADLENLISKSVGIGEHVRLSQDVADLISELDANISKLETLNRYLKQYEQ